MPTTIEHWQQSNIFSVSLRGHDKYIPQQPPETLAADLGSSSDLVPKTDLTYYLQTKEGDANFNSTYDSFYSPADFKMNAITLRTPIILPETVSYEVSIKVNGAEIELMPVPQAEDHNLKVYGTACDVSIWEDDYFEISINIQGDWNELNWNDHNLAVCISGCYWYEGYKSIFPEGTKEWTLGDNYFKTNIMLQNRSGNDILKNRLFLDVVKSPMSFLLQGIRLSLFEDFLMTDEKLPRPYTCFYVDLLVNGKSVNKSLGLPYPASLDLLNTRLRSYNSVHNNKQGFSILVGDDIMMRVYLRNFTASYNSKIIQANLIGCASDCVTNSSSPVTVYELCAATPCVTKFAVNKPCTPAKRNPVVICETATGF